MMENATVRKFMKADQAAKVAQKVGHRVDVEATFLLCSAHVNRPT
jgi:hypothetical protein